MHSCIKFTPAIKRKTVYLYLSLLAIACSASSANAEAPPVPLPVMQSFSQQITQSIVDPLIRQRATFLYSVNAFDGSIAGFRVDRDNNGKLIHNGHWPTDQFPTAVITHPSGRFLYVSSKVSDEIDIYQINPQNGRLKLLQGKSVKAGRAPHLFSMAPSGQYLYIALRSGSIAVFKINSKDGTLVPVTGSPFLAEKRTRSLVVHPSGQFVYASNAHSNSISAYRVDTQSGALTSLPNSPFDAGDNAPMGKFMDPMLDMPPGAGAMPYYIATDPTGGFLYVTNWNAASVSGFQINKETGQLLPINGSPFRAGFNPYVVTVHPSGRYVYVSGYEPNIISIYRIESTTGVLTPISDSPYETKGDFPISIKFDQEGKIAYVANYRSNNITVFDVDMQSGALSFTGLVQTRSGPRDLSIAVDANLVEGAGLTVAAKKTTEDNRYLYIINAATDTLTAYKRNQGAAKWRKIASVRTGKNPSAIAIHPLSNLIYVTNQASNNISSFLLNTKTEKLIPIEDAPYPVDQSPNAITFDRNGRFLYITNQDSNNMSVFEVNTENGRLIQTKSINFASGPNPSAITIDPADRYAYILNAGNNTISLFRYRTASSPLVDNMSRVGGVFKTGDKPVSLTVDSSGRFLYVANENSKNISAYLIHMQSGFLQGLEGSPFKMPGTAVSLVTHPGKNYLYVLNRDSKKIGVYTIDKFNGGLKQVQFLSFVGGLPTKLKISPSGEFLYLYSNVSNRLQVYAIDTNTGRLNIAFTETMKITVTDIAFGNTALQ